MLTWTYIIVFEISVKHNFQTLLYTHYGYTYSQGSTLLQT